MDLNKTRPLVQLCTYEERQDALKRTSMMDDENSHRSTRNFAESPAKHSDITTNGHKSDGRTQDAVIPPPPPQFANSPPKPAAQQPQTSLLSQHLLRNSPQTRHLISTPSKPPASPVPDYEHIQTRSTQPTSQANPQRHTLRLGTVTIGEYESPGRKEPSKFEFLAKQPISHNKNLSPASPNVGGFTLQSELQHTLKKSNLKKTQSGGVANGFPEQQTPGLLQENYEHFDYRRSNNMAGNLSQKVQNLSLANGKSDHQHIYQPSVKINPLKNGYHGANGTTSNGTTTGGILKNSATRNSASTNGHSKSHEKSISFGN